MGTIEANLPLVCFECGNETTRVRTSLVPRPSPRFSSLKFCSCMRSRLAYESLGTRSEQLREEQATEN